MSKPKKPTQAEKMPSGSMTDAAATETDAAPASDTGTGMPIGAMTGDGPAALVDDAGMPRGDMADAEEMSEPGEMPSGAMTDNPGKAPTMTLDELNEASRCKHHVPQVAGLSRGDSGDEVERLQEYLKKFGYCESAEREEFGVVGEVAVPPAPNEGEFDAATEAALKRFQAFNHLPETGMLDEATLELMGRPRCGFPDTAEFTLEGRRWNRNNLTYAFREFSADLTQAQCRTAIQQAFALWAAVTPLTFTEVALNASPDIVIRFVAGNHGDGSNFDGAGGVLAHAFYPPPNGGDLAGDAHFDEAETWSVNLPPSGTDLVTVAATRSGLPTRPSPGR